METTFRHVLLATDLAGTTSRALSVALALAERLGAQLTLVHVCDLARAVSAAAGEVTVADLITPDVEAAREKLKELAATLQGRCPAVHATVRVGTPWEEILATAAAVGADAIVAGTHGRTGLAHAVLGSVAEKLVRMSPVPVLTVPVRGAA